jgi:hypothetical protein
VKPGKMKKFAANIGLVCVLGVLAGCQAFTKTPGSRNEDPLLGANVAPVNATALDINPANTGAGASSLPPLTKASPTSAAALAGGAYPPLVGGQDLRIGTAPATAGGNRIQPPHLNPKGVLAVVTADPNHGQPADPNPPGVIPLDPTGVRPATLASQPPPSLSTSGLDQAFASLANYNPKWHRLDNQGPGVWRFTCSVTDRGDPSKSRTYETEGSTATIAVQAALDRMARN